MVSARAGGRRTQTRECKQTRQATPTSHAALFHTCVYTSPGRQAHVARAGKEPALNHISAQAAAAAGAKRRGPSGAAAAGLAACGVVAAAGACSTRRTRACGGVFAAPPRSSGVGAAATPPPRDDSGDASTSGPHQRPSHAHPPRTVAQAPPAPVASLSLVGAARAAAAPLDSAASGDGARVHPHTTHVHCIPALPPPPRCTQTRAPLCRATRTRAIVRLHVAGSAASELAAASASRTRRIANTSSRSSAGSSLQRARRRLRRFSAFRSSFARRFFSFFMSRLF